MASIVETCYSAGNLFVACELGFRASKLFTDLEDIALEFNWYQFPSETQRMLPTVLIVLQDPVAIECFGSFSCNRECFKQVSHKKFVI